MFESIYKIIDIVRDTFDNDESGALELKGPLVLSTKIGGSLPKDKYPDSELEKKIEEYSLNFTQLEDTLSTKADVEKLDKLELELYKLKEEHFRRNLNSQLQGIAKAVNDALEAKGDGRTPEAIDLLREATVLSRDFEMELLKYKSRADRLSLKDLPGNEVFEEYRKIQKKINQVQNFIHEQTMELYSKNKDMKKTPA